MNAYPARASFTTFPETFTNLTGGKAGVGGWRWCGYLVVGKAAGN